MIPNPALVPVDFSNWIQVPQPAPADRPYTLSVSKDGHIRLSERLYKKIEGCSPSMTFDFRIAPGGKLLAFIPAESGYHFPASGQMKDVELSKSLLGYGVVLTAQYHVAWNENAGAWVGCLATEVCNSRAKALQKSISGGNSKKGGGRI